MGKVSTEQLQKYAVSGLIVRIRAERQKLQAATDNTRKQHIKRVLNSLIADYYEILNDLTRYNEIGLSITKEQIKKAMTEKVYFTKQEIIELSTTNHPFKMSELLEIMDYEYETEEEYQEICSAISWVIDKGLIIDDSEVITEQAEEEEEELRQYEEERKRGKKQC